MKSIHDVLFDLSFADVFIFSEFVWRGLICARVQAQLRFQKGISEIEFCRLVAAGIVSTTFIWRTWGLLTGNLESSLPVETSARRTGVRSSFNEQELLCHITWHKTDRQREHCILFRYLVCCVCVSLWLIVLRLERKEEAWRQHVGVEGETVFFDTALL